MLDGFLAGGLNILIIDAYSTYTVWNELNYVGLKLDVAFNQEEGFMMAHAERYDIILIDLEMPECNAYELTRMIRQSRGKSFNSYIVALSGEIETKEQVYKCIEVGMNDFILKPLNMKILKLRIQMWSRLAQANRLK